MSGLTEIADGIYQVRFNLERARYQSRVYLVAGERGAVVETGPAFMVPSIMEALKGAPGGLKGVGYIIPTHLHLDHGGGAGALAQALRGATVVAHQRAVHHLADPSRLIEGTRLAFGHNFEEHYGPILPVAPERVQPVAGGEAVDLGGRELRVVYTPGHAPHHLCLLDSRTRALFTGEALGHYLPDTGLLVPSIPLPMLELDASLRSIDRIQELSPRLLVFSQFGHAPHTEALIREARLVLAAASRIVLSCLRDGGSQREAAAKLLAYYGDRASHLNPQGPPVRLPGAWEGTCLQAVQSLRAYFHTKGLI
jgi:glyoxylase-like metal-dependent hydrolase (beta-lactamase superfamily II)